MKMLCMLLGKKSYHWSYGILKDDACSNAVSSGKVPTGTMVK